jgi:hypothetical protein
MLQKEYIAAIIFAVIAFIGLILILVAALTIKPADGPAGDKDRKKKRDMNIAGGVLLSLGLIAVGASVIMGKKANASQIELAEEYFDAVRSNNREAAEAACDRFMNSRGGLASRSYSQFKEGGQNYLSVCQDEAAGMLNQHYKVPRYKMYQDMPAFGPNYNYQQASQRRVPVLPPALSQRKLASIQDELP